MRVLLHPGYHSDETRQLVENAWVTDDCVIFCPPRIRDFRFLSFLPEGDLVAAGDWRGRTPPDLTAVRRTEANRYPERPAYGVFTTGTSGATPRLVLYSRRNVRESIDRILGLFEASRISALFCYPQPSHTFGLVLGYLASQLSGYRLVTGTGKYSSQFHQAWWDALEPGMVTLGTPTHFRDLLAFCECRGETPRPSYSAIIGGGPVTVSLWQDLRERLRIESPSIGYGASEASPGISHLPPGVTPREDGEVGFFLPHIETRIEPEGLWFRGSNLALAFVDEKGLSFPKEGWLADVLSPRADGRLIFEGRRDAVCNRGGEKIALDPIERGLARALGTEVLCTTIEDARLGEELGILVRGEALPPGAGGALANVLGREVSGAKWESVSELPVGENGKPCRTGAREIFRRRAAAGRFPVSTASLLDKVPHRFPMVWVDEVESAEDGRGRCVVRYRQSGAYAGPTGLRPSSLIELIAQSFAFVQACALVEGEKPRRAFLAAVSKMELAKDRRPLEEGETLTISVERVRQMGGLSLVRGSVSDGRGVALAKGELKLFAE